MQSRLRVKMVTRETSTETNHTMFNELNHLAICCWYFVVLLWFFVFLMFLWLLPWIDLVLGYVMIYECGYLFPNVLSISWN